MTYEESIKEGWNFTAKSTGAVLGATAGNKFVSSVQTELLNLEDELNAEITARKTMGTSQLAGNLAEIFHAGTFNMNAALNESKNRAERLGQNGFASADIHLLSGENYSSKYIETAQKSADAQRINIQEYYYNIYLKNAKKNKYKSPDSFEEYCKKHGYDPNDKQALVQSIYSGQGRIIPADQLDAARAHLKELCKAESGKTGPNRQAVLRSYEETLKSLSDRIKDADGIESIPLTKEEAELLAQMGQDDTLDLRQFGLSLDQLVTNEYIFRQALKTGYTSAITTLVLQLAPEIFKSIDYLIKSGEIDKEQLEKTGLTLLSASSEGFIRGSVSSALTIAYMSGRLGTVLSGIGEDAIPGVIGSMTVIVIDAIKDSVRVASGKMAYEEMGEHLLRSIIVSASGIATGTLMQTLLTGAPTLGYMLGSFVGSAVASLVVDSAEKAFISVCINTGFTFFGLVKQDYALPESLIKDMGLDCFDFKTFESESFKPESFEFRSFEFQTFKFETIDIKVLKRGLVSVSTIGYVLD